MCSAAATSPPPVVRMGHLMAFSSFINNVGIPVDKLLCRSRLPVLCDDANYFVPLARAWSFFDDAAASLDPGLGWLVGKHVGDHNLNPALRAKLESAPSLYLALYWLVDKVRLEASHLRLGMCERKDDVLIFTHYPSLQGMPGYHHSQAYQLCVFLDLIQQFLGRGWCPEEVGIQARCMPSAVRQQFPDSRIMLGKSYGYITVPLDSLHRRVEQEESVGVGESSLPLNRSFDFEETLRGLVMAYLYDGYPSAALAAELMDMSERTLARRLSKLGLTYGDLVDEVRFMVAKRLLRRPEARVGDVAMAVGFEDQSNFARMFRRIGGVSPRDFRKANIH